MFGKIVTMTTPIHLSWKKADKNPNLRWRALNEFLAFVPKLASAQRVAYLAYSYSWHIEIGGHYDYFSTRRFYDPEVLSALVTVGATEQASILTTVLDAIRAASDLAPQKYSNRFAAGVETADLSEFDEAWGRCTRSVAECLLDYTSKHESDFFEWKP